MADIFNPSANDPAVYTTDRFGPLRDKNGNVYRTVVKSNVNGNIDVYDKGTGFLGADRLIFQYNASTNTADFNDGDFQGRYGDFFQSPAVRQSNSRWLTNVKREWYQEAPPNAAARMATLDGYKAIASTTSPRSQGTTLPQVTIQTTTGPLTVSSPQTPPPDPSGGTAPGTGAQPDLTNFTTTVPGLTEQKEGSYNPPGAATAWIYPTGLGKNQQDYIEFQMIEYGGLKGKGFSANGIGLESRNLGTKVLGRVFLPTQPTIADINTVDWQNDSINPLQLLGAKASLGAITGTMTEADFSQLAGQFSDNKAVQNYLQQWAAGKAVGLNIFSRFSGAVVNPNLELLFNGPQLRPFNFSFRLSPRSEDEAAQVKGIIRFFKKGMAVRKSGAGGEGLFLKAPNVFKIIYRNGNNKNKEHTSINKIKVCALTQCGVDYTPDGSYATFYDDESTMTQYGLTLQFNELEPIFNEDYDKDAPGKSTIGY